jgi:hypothetical protein
MLDTVGTTYRKVECGLAVNLQSSQWWQDTFATCSFISQVILEVITCQITMWNLKHSCKEAVPNFRCG